MKFKELKQAELDGLIARVEEAIENNLALDSEDLRLLLNAIQTLMMLQNKIEDQDITLTKLKKLLGIIQSSEKSNSSKAPRKTSKKPRKNNKNVKDGKKLATENHAMQGLEKGDACPKCTTLKKGKLYKYAPIEFIRITAHAPYEKKKHVAERLRCNLCQAIFTAEVPKAVLEDGPINQMYGYTARSAMAIEKFFSGLAYHHQEKTSFFSGLSIPASTIYDQVEALSVDATPAYKQILKLAADAQLFLLDDTKHRILSQQPQLRPNRNGKGERLRTGVYCSGLIAHTLESHELVMFETSLGHSGEFVDSVLVKRNPELSKPKVMSDALSSNHVTVCEVEQGLCNSHARRNFINSESKFPEEVEHVLNLYGKVWKNEHKIEDLELNSEQRLLYHKKHSLPIMEDLKSWCMQQQALDDFEEHSCLGKAIAYFIKHYDCLIAFCVVVGMPIDNNRTEETLKMPIRGRKNYMFFKTVAGATVANIIMTLIMTAYRANENPLDYLTALQKYQADLKSQPQCWMPWNYKSRIKEMLSEKKAQAA